MPSISILIIKYINVISLEILFGFDAVLSDFATEKNAIVKSVGRDKEHHTPEVEQFVIPSSTLCPDTLQVHRP